MIEAMAQTGAMSCISADDISKKEMNVLIAKVNSARFRKSVTPGDTVVMKSTIVKDRGKMFVLQCEARVDGDVVADLEILAHVVLLDKTTT